MIAQYASDLVEMTNNFASKHIDHIAVLTRQMHECQIGSELAPMINVLQHTVSLQVGQTKGLEESPSSGFEEVLKSLPIREVKSFVDGIQRLMERAKSLQDLIVMTERENERKRADARIEAQRQASEERIRELMEENARLKAMVEQQQSASASAATSTSQVPVVRKSRAKKVDPRRQHRNVEASAAIRKESPPKSPDIERNSGYGHRASHPGEIELEGSIETPEPLDEGSGYRSGLRFRKRPLTEKAPAEDITRRSKRQMSHYGGSTGTFNLEEDSDFLFWGRAEHFGSRAHPEKSLGDGMNKQQGHSTSSWAHFPAEPRDLDSYVPMAEPGTPETEIHDGRTPDKTGDPSAGFAGDTGEEPEPVMDFEEPPEPKMTPQETKLVENIEQMHGMVEKLSLLLQVGQHAIGAHEEGVIVTAQSQVV